MKRAFLTFLVLLLSTGTAASFDGYREGIVVGGGIGVSPYSGWKVFVDDADIDESGAGLAVNLILGYAWTERDMVVYEGNVTAWDSDYFGEAVAQGFDAVSYYRYFGEPGKAAFLGGGIGVYRFIADRLDDQGSGYSLHVHGGYEFAKHFQVNLTYAFGTTSSGSLDFDHHHLSLLLNAIAF